MMTHSQIEFVWNWTDDEQLIHWKHVQCAGSRSRVKNWLQRFSDHQNTKPFLSDTSDLRTDDLIILHMRASANIAYYDWHSTSEPT